MFESTQTHMAGAPEIQHGPQHSASRSWKNLRRSTVPKDQSNVGQHESHAHHGPRCSLTRPRTRWLLTKLIVKHTLVLLFFSVPVILLALVIKVPHWDAFSSDYWDSGSFSHCNFNGKFTPEDKPTLSLWNPAGFFYISVSWGKWTFSTAKFIDIVWDVVVGRGGQAFLALVTFKVSSQYLALAMRDAPVSYNTFESLAFVPPGVVRTARLAGDLFTNRGWRARLIVLWIVLSWLFVLSFSTLITAMSGYSSNIDAVMPNLDNESVMWSNYLTVQFAINDAQRIGHDGPLYITTGYACVQQGFLADDDDDDDSGYHRHVATKRLRRRDDDDDDQDNNSSSANSNGTILWDYVPADCTLFWHAVQYVSKYGPNSKKNTASQITLNGTTHNISAPALDITTSYSSTALSTLTTYLNTFSESSPPAIDSLSAVSALTDNTFWLYEDDIYPLSYVLDKASCQYSQWHNWGFSFLFLFLTSLLLAIWSVGTYFLWLYTSLNGNNRHLTGGIYRSSWTLVEAMQRDIGPAAVTSLDTEQDIRDLVGRRHGRMIQGIGKVGTYPPQPPIPTDSEKTPNSPSYQNHSTAPRFTTFRNWLAPSCAHSSSITHFDSASPTPVNSVFSTITPSFSTTSDHPILHSPAAPGRTMTMTSRLSSLASPSTEPPPEFGFSAATEADLLTSSPLNSPTGFEAGGVGSGPSSPTTATPGRTRPRLSLSRAIRSSWYAGNNPHTASASATPTTARWVASPGALTPSEQGSSPITPIREDGRGKEREREGDENAVRWRNDLGDG